MSARHWQPGDVARIQYDRVDQIGVVRRRVAAGGALEFAYGSGGFDMVADETVGPAARPLVVIDPEDPQQVERLYGALAARVGMATISEALRSLVALPKPEEPTDFAAQVRDRNGLRWVKLTGHSWLCEDGTQVGGYALVDAVEVLS